VFNRQIYENSQPGGIGLLEIVGEMEETEAGGLFVPLKRTELRGEITGPLAALRLIQTYGYSREQCDQVLEAVYRFPLPGDAAVTGSVELALQALLVDPMVNDIDQARALLDEMLDVQRDYLPQFQP